MIKNHEIIDRTYDITQYILGTLKEFDDIAREKSIDCNKLITGKNGLERSIEILKVLKDTVKEDDYNTRAKYLKEVVYYTLESYFNNLQGCEYETDEVGDK